MVIIDNFSQFGWTTPLRSKNAQPLKDPFDNLLISSKRKQFFLIESDCDKEFYNSLFQEFLIKINIQLYSRNSSFGSVFADRFNCTKRVLLKRPVFEKGDGNCTIVLPAITNKHINRVYTSTKLTPI